MQISESTFETLRLKLRYKVRYHLGPWCPDVDDVVQETLSRIIAAARNQQIRSPDSIGAFASATCTNVIREYRRGLWREVVADLDVGRADPSASAAEELEMQDLIDRTFAELPERDRELLQAFYIDEKSAEEISRELDYKEGTFRVALFRARERFRRISTGSLKSEAHGTH
jgi:RNA polymerase sigma factor (sigma-70 family)